MHEENKNTAIIKWEPPKGIHHYIDALKDKKRAELEAALQAGAVGEPISTTAILTSIAISAAMSAASYGLTRLLTPKPKPQRVGTVSGSLQLQNSEQGIFIPEIYGGGPDFVLSPGSNPTFQNNVNGTVGANGAYTKSSGGTAWNCGASHNVAVQSGDNAFFQITLGTGYATAGFTLTASPDSGNEDFLYAIQWNPDGSISIKYNGTFVIGGVTTWQTGDVFRVELRNNHFRLYKGFSEITTQNFAPPTPAYPLYIGIAVQIVGAGISASKVLVGDIGYAPNAGSGGCKVPAILVWTTGLRKTETPITQPAQGGKGHAPAQTTIQVSYDLDVAAEWGRGPLDLLRLYGNADVLYNIDPFLSNPTGVYDPGVGSDDDYTPITLPNPQLQYISPVLRMDADLVDLDPGDPGGGQGGPIQGGSSQLSVYPGSMTQLPDPTIEADIDSKYGIGSTPAYRGHALTVHATFKLDRWQGIFPNLTAVWQHQTIHTLGAVFVDFCTREGLEATDYDFTSIDDIAVRGLLLAGSRYAPQAVMDSSELQGLYNYFTTEGDGKILAFQNGDEPTINIPETEFGWLDAESDIPNIVQTITVSMADETSLPRMVNVKYIDPGNDWDPNLQTDQRKIVAGREIKAIEVSATANPDEAKSAAQRMLYNEYVAGSTYKFTLPWTYMYLYPGYKITTTLAEGFSYAFRLLSISGGAGLLECEAVALEVEAFTQPAVGAGPPAYNPGQVIPTMTVAVPLNLPALRDTDKHLGFYIGATPRSGLLQGYKGYTLWRERSNEWLKIVTISGPSIIGKVVSATALESDPDVTDVVGEIIVDLFGTTPLSSVPEADMIAGANRAAFGDLICGFADVVQDPDFPNRWILSTLRNGQNNTQDRVGDALTDKPFVFLDDTVHFIPLDETDANNAITYKAVTIGQSLPDAANITFTCTGESVKPARPTNFTGVRVNDADWYFAATGNPTVAEMPAAFMLRLRKIDGTFLRDIPMPAATYRLSGLFEKVTPLQPITVTNNNLYSTGLGLGTVNGIQEVLTDGVAITFKVTLDLSQAEGDSAVIFYLNSDGPLGYGPACGVTVSNVDDASVRLTGLENYDVVIGPEIIAATDGVIYILVALVGTEVRVYGSTSGVPVPGLSQAILIGKEVSTLFPAFISVQMRGLSQAENFWIAGLTDPRTIYPLRQQQSDDGQSAAGPGLADLDAEIWQVSPFAYIDNKGFSTRKVFP